MSWIAEKVFANADDFLDWLDQNFSDYIEKHISENHVHHTYIPNHSHYPKYTTLQLHKNMRSFHVNTNKWDDIAQNITIGKDGDIITGRDICKIPISAKGYNGSTDWHPFAYEMIGNFDKGNDKLEGEQLDAAIKISRYFYLKGKGVKFHRELLINGKQPKSCPGTGIEKDWFMEMVKTDNKQSLLCQPVPDKFGMFPNGVIMKVKALVTTDIRKAPSHNGAYVRDAKVGEIFDVYGIENDWHCVGGANWIDGNNGKNLYWIDNPTLLNSIESKKEYVVLPASSDSWRVYPTNKAPVKGNEKGCLNPKRFNGLTYEVLGHPQANIVTIYSANFGRVNIYVAPSTGAKFIWK